MSDRSRDINAPPWTRRKFVGTMAAMATGPNLLHVGEEAKSLLPLPTPSPSQLLWQRDERALFIHLGVNTFTNREWGDGTESPTLFDPTALDAGQWARTAREAGFKAMILTAKHHDGFCLWPTATTRHSVASAPFRDGDGDVVAEFVEACRDNGLRAGLYLSPWDRNSPVYGNSSRYDDFYVDQLTELLTNYGKIHEVWFDGANGEGPNGRHQVYDWPRYWSTVRRLQSDAVIFSDAGPDIRWIGNERGAAGETNWSTVDPTVVTRPGMTGDRVMQQLREGDRDGTVWRPGETDVSIRPGWFWHPAEDGQVRSVDDLVDLYFTSVGRNSKLLLNVPPTRQGLLHSTDIERLAGMNRRLDAMLGMPISAASLDWRATGPATGVATLTGIAGKTPIGTVDLAEEISVGQRVAGYIVEARVGGAWRVIARGTTIGYRRLHQVEPVVANAVRLRVNDTIATPLPITIRAFPAV